MSDLDQQLAQLGHGVPPQAAAAQNWRAELEAWALEYAERLSRGVGAGGVVIGGSIARGEQWEHSDLEVAVLVEKIDPTLPHFSVDNGRGVELFQLEKSQLKQQLAAVEDGDLTPVASWPTQPVPSTRGGRPEPVAGPLRSRL